MAKAKVNPLEVTALPIDIKTPEAPTGIKIRTAFCHTPVVVPGYIGGEKTLSPQRIPGAEMTYTPMGLFIRSYGKAGAAKGVAVTTIVPLSNVVNAIIDA